MKAQMSAELHQALLGVEAEAVGVEKPNRAKKDLKDTQGTTMDTFRLLYKTRLFNTKNWVFETFS